MSRFLLAFDRSTGEILEMHEGISTAREAIHERLRVEELYRDRVTVEVVVLTAETEDDLRRTHARYFEGVVELARRADSAI